MVGERRRTRPNLLLVEDDPAHVMLLRETFELTEIEVNLHVARDGEEALAFLRGHGPHENAPVPGLVLLDLNLPGKTGAEVLAEIREDESLKHIPVMVLSSSSAERDVLECYHLGCNCYVNKPVGLEQLERLVRAFDDFWFELVSLPRPKRR